MCIDHFQDGIYQQAERRKGLKVVIGIVEISFYPANSMTNTSWVLSGLESFVQILEFALINNAQFFTRSFDKAFFLEL